ncbi:MAG: cell division protein DivIVA [Erysipelothrix sp.]|jgi:cell division initiation protein|nr:cell division protein DivIVA [Erysipelothrix sp.]
MSEQTRFRLLRKGYDRFAVDETLDELETQIEAISKKLEVYELQVEQAEADKLAMKEKYTKLVNELIVKEKAADDIARLALREANMMIDKAGDHADLIIREALATAKTLLSELVRIASEAKDSKEMLKVKVHEIATLIDSLEFPQTRDFEWIVEDKNEDQDRD